MVVMPSIEIILLTMFFVKIKVYLTKLLFLAYGKIVEFTFNIVGETIVRVEKHITEYVIGTKITQIVALRHYEQRQ